MANRKYTTIGLALTPARFVGDPCTRCQNCVRYKANHRCVRCQMTFTPAEWEVVKQRKAAWARERRRNLPVRVRKAERIKAAAVARLWRKNNPDRFKAIIKKRRGTPEGKITLNLRRRLWRALQQQGVARTARTFELVGCSVAALRAHLERQFRPGMSWDNYGEWEMDHIIPCARFDLTDPKQQQRCFSYRNLQPLWKTENRSKNRYVL